ncbi:uncharacterized protein LOC123193951 [Mangifera indica]|uniref:uncharacterized protein LOC123193951 n=1 Tax=Mangifera indica TaxID=29780 RepID=UPI001CFB0504|nr:uncharacterized protein LOC123193951 [Mangifera indica]
MQSEDGDIIDCIDIYKQPAFAHPALRDHKIQMAPSYEPTAEPMAATRPVRGKTLRNRYDRSSMTLASQIWKKNGTCPEGTVPVRRIQNGLLEANSPEAYRRYKSIHPTKQLQDDENPNTQLPNRSKAMLLTLGNIYSGAKADIKVWDPFVESDDEFSTSRVSLQSGPYYDFESIESGWAVNPRVYGDKKTRLYVYWTVDGSKKTGCFDLTCPGFVQTSNEIALGASIYPISVVDGLPYQITIYIFKDPNTSNWWVQYGEKINVGYWPHGLFTLIKSGAESVEWGGEVYSLKLGRSPHTATEMGNGRYADPIFGNSGYIKRMRILDNSHILKFPEWVSTYADEYNCYDVYYISDYVEDPELYFGGPGRSYRCP